MRRLVPVALFASMVACGSRDVIRGERSLAPPAAREFVLDQTPKAQRRMVPPEVFLRGYLAWFGADSPRDAFLRARGADLFDSWHDYLGALGLPDHHVDTPRLDQSNTVMSAVVGRLAEALCVRSAEHDLRSGVPIGERRIFAFDVDDIATVKAFSPGFDVLHRTFLGYPAALAPPARVERFFTLFKHVVANHRPGEKLSPQVAGWAAVCTALVQHPEARSY